VPPEARGAHLKVLLEDAIASIERHNPALKDALPNQYARVGLDKQRLGQLIDQISNIRVGDEASCA
jgi:type I restriction enzyme M protein